MSLPHMQCLLLFMLDINHVAELPVDGDTLLNQPVLESAPEKTVSISLPAPHALNRKKLVTVLSCQ